MEYVLDNTERQQYNYQTFYNKLVEICLEHKQRDKALVFAFILYNFQNPQIAKIIQDQVYWRDLDDLTGDYLSVFSINHKPKRRLKRRPGYGSPRVHQMYGITDFQNPDVTARGLLEKYFEIGVDIEFPAVLLFQIHNDKVIDYTLIMLDEPTIESAFLELKEYLTSAVQVLKKIAPECKGNSQQIFDLVEQALQSKRSIKTMGKWAKKILPLGEFLVSLMGSFPKPANSAS